MNKIISHSIDNLPIFRQCPECMRHFAMQKDKENKKMKCKYCNYETTYMPKEKRENKNLY